MSERYRYSFFGSAEGHDNAAVLLRGRGKDREDICNTSPGTCSLTDSGCIPLLGWACSGLYGVNVQCRGGEFCFGRWSATAQGEWARGSSESSAVARSGWVPYDCDCVRGVSGRGPFYEVISRAGVLSEIRGQPIDQCVGDAGCVSSLGFDAQRAIDRGYSCGFRGTGRPPCVEDGILQTGTTVDGSCEPTGCLEGMCGLVEDCGTQIRCPDCPGTCTSHGCPRHYCGEIVDNCGNVIQCERGCSAELPAGATVQAQPPDLASGQRPITIAFPAISVAGKASLARVSELLPPPSRFQPASPDLQYELSTSAVYTASRREPLTVCVSHADVTFPATGQPQLFRRVRQHWENITTAGNNARHILCGRTTTLGVFGVFQPTNEAPTAVAGSDQVVVATTLLGASVSLDGSASFDPNGDALRYRWTDSSGHTVLEEAAGVLWLPLGTSPVVLTVEDAKGGIAADGLELTVWDPPPEPEITAPGAGVVSGQLQLAAEASDNIATLGLQFGVDGVPISGELSRPPFITTWDSHRVSDGSHVVRAVARDGSGGTGAATVDIIVDNSPPAMAVSASPGKLQASGNTLVPVIVTIAVQDSIDPEPSVVLQSILCQAASDPSQTPCEPKDIQGAEYGTRDLSFSVLAAPLRAYSIVYRAADKAGNATTSVAQVTVTAAP